MHQQFIKVENTSEFTKTQNLNQTLGCVNMYTFSCYIKKYHRTQRIKGLVISIDSTSKILDLNSIILYINYRQVPHFLSKETLAT